MAEATGQVIPTALDKSPSVQELIRAKLDAADQASGRVPPAQPAKQDAPADDYQPGPNADPEGQEQPQEAEPVEQAGEQQEQQSGIEIPLDQLEAIELETTYKGDGGADVTEKLPIKELKSGYMRQKDYQQKTAQLARQREEAQEQARQAMNAERAAFEQQVQQLQATLIETVAPELKNVDWTSLATSDPMEYIRLKARAEQVSGVINGMRQRAEEAKSKREADTRQAQLVAAQKTWATLESDVPNWSADAYKAALKAGESVGYTENEVGAWLDARAIKLLHKAHLYDQLQAGKPAADKKVVTAPKVIKPGATSTPSKAQGKIAQLHEQARRSGKLNDVAALIRAKL